MDTQGYLPIPTVVVWMMGLAEGTRGPGSRYERTIQFSLISLAMEVANVSGHCPEKEE